MRQFVEYNSGSQPSQNEEGIYFGLGKDQLESIQVLWPISTKKGKEAWEPLKRNYHLAKLRFNYHLDVTLCENGQLLIGRKKTCSKK